MEGETQTFCLSLVQEERLVGPGHQRFCSSALGRGHSETYRHRNTGSINTTAFRSPQTAVRDAGSAQQPGSRSDQRYMEDEQLPPEQAQEEITTQDKAEYSSLTLFETHTPELAQVIWTHQELISHYPVTNIFFSSLEFFKTSSCKTLLKPRAWTQNEQRSQSIKPDTWKKCFLFSTSSMFLQRQSGRTLRCLYFWWEGNPAHFFVWSGHLLYHNTFPCLCSFINRWFLNWETPLLWQMVTTWQNMDFSRRGASALTQIVDGIKADERDIPGADPCYWSVFTALCGSWWLSC